MVKTTERAAASAKREATLEKRERRWFDTRNERKGIKRQARRAMRRWGKAICKEAKD